MYIAKTSRRKGFHKLSIPTAKKIGSMIKVPKVPKLNVPKLNHKSKY